MTRSFIFSALAIAGPALTTLGAGLLAYDVLRGPLRHVRRKGHADRLRIEERGRDRSLRDVAARARLASTEEHELALAGVDATFNTVMDQTNDRFDEAAEHEYRRAFLLGVAGLALVGLGGMCQTAAAVLASLGLERVAI